MLKWKIDKEDGNDIHGTEINCFAKINDVVPMMVLRHAHEKYIGNAGFLWGGDVTNIIEFKKKYEKKAQNNFETYSILGD